MANIERGEIVIEIDHRRIINDEKQGKIVVGNSDVRFHPIDENLRSRIIPQRSVGAGVKRVWDGIPSIPGQRVHVNPKTMKLRITNALGDPENALILEQVLRAEKASSSGVRALTGGVSGPQKDRTIPLNSPEEMHNALYWMRRLVDQQHANLIQGELLREEEYRDGGDIRVPGDPEIARKENGSIYMRPNPKAEAAVV